MKENLLEIFLVLMVSFYKILDLNLSMELILELQ